MFIQNIKCFEFHNFENGKVQADSVLLGRQHLQNGQKKFIIGYRFSIGELGYQFDIFKTWTTFYLDHLGLAGKKQFPDFQQKDKLIAFKHILHDFEYLVDDFFVGSCDKLIEAAILQDNYVKELRTTSQDRIKLHPDKMRIEKARQKFKELNTKKV